MRNSQLVTVSLPPEVLEQIDAAAQRERRTRSNFIRTALERSLTGEGRMAALQAIADAGLADAANATQERAPNPSQVVAESSADGHARLNALQKIAAGNRKAPTPPLTSTEKR